MAIRTICLIHHSHTDIGYTDVQEKLELFHADYIRRVLDILKAEDVRGERAFFWQCENYWQVENFYQEAAPEETSAFEGYVREGRIGLSGNYLNMTELIGDAELRSRLDKGRAYAESIGVRTVSAMSADINGYSWGFPDALAEAGVKYLFSALHPHHGMFPMGHNPSCFYWKGPKGGRVLAFCGEHYHLGNELGFVPHANSSYLIYDDIRFLMEQGRILHTDAHRTASEEMYLAVKRISQYIESLEESGYPFDTVPIMVSGVISDNAPPNDRIVQRAEQLNRMMDGRVNIRMDTLDGFFTAIERQNADIPEYTGDWTDWWADGVGSTPAAVKVYKEAQRNSDLARKLDPEGKSGSAALRETAARNMMLYAEHTWGYSTSISEPWNSMVISVGMRKDRYAADAAAAAYRELCAVKRGMGEITPYPDRPHRCRIVNPHDHAISAPVSVILDHWEYIDGIAADRFTPLALRECRTGKLLPSQMHPAPRGNAVETALTLAPHESIDIEVCRAELTGGSVPHHPYRGADGMTDIAGTEGLVSPYYIDTRYHAVTIEAGKGITSIYDKVRSAELIDPEAGIGAFTGVYEVTSSTGRDGMAVRREMGRNRRSLGTKRSTAVLTDARIMQDGAVFAENRLSYALDGMEFFDVWLRVYKTIPLIEARLCMHKKSCLDPENVYLALPFLSGETYIDKTGCTMRPGIDQLPGTCEDFYLIQNGLMRRSSGFDVLCALKDTPLVSFSLASAGPVRLCDGRNEALNRFVPYAWVMNNFWETNFQADLGGVYEFSFAVETADTAEADAQLKHCEARNEGFIVLEI